MSYGPIELLVVKFPGNQFTGDITPALRELVEGGLIRIIDILFVQKDGDGNVTETELNDLVEDVYNAYEPLVADWTGLLTHDDAVLLTSMLEANSSAGIMLFENTWATAFASAVRAANGQVVVNERIPHAVIEELLAAQPVLESS